AWVPKSKNKWVGKGVKEKDKVVDIVSPDVTDEPVVNEKQDTLVDRGSPNVENTGGNGIDVVVLLESIRAISERFSNTAYGFFLGKQVAYPVVANYVRNT
ncbi:hypothetical protein Tco_0095408, partial [Tanacetum coccineum]